MQGSILVNFIKKGEIGIIKNLDQHTLQILLEKGIIKPEHIEDLNRPNHPPTNCSVEDCIKYFTIFLNSEYSDNTVSGYKTNVENFLGFYFGNNDFKGLGAMPVITKQDVEKWFTYLVANGYSASSIRRFKHSLISFFQFLKGEFNYNAPYIGNIETPAQEVSEIDALRHEEIRLMAEYTKNLRDKLIILLIYEAGMRRNELIDCKKSFINFDDRSVGIYNNGKLDRISIISHELCVLIKEYITEWEDEVSEINRKRQRRSREKGEKYTELFVSDYLFQTPRSEKISYAIVFQAIKEASFDFFFHKEMKSGSTKEEATDYAQQRANVINTETMRHSKRAYLFSIGKTTEQVQVIMGDENKYQVKRYLKIAQRLYPEKF